jgi:acyl dehydratase
MTVHTLAELPMLVGADLGATAWRTLTQADFDTFGDLTGDRQWIHADPAAAARGPFGATIAHGYLTLALIGGLWAELFSVRDAALAVHYGLDRVRFPAPVPVRSRVRLRASVHQVVPIVGGMRLHVDQTIELEGSDRPAIVARGLYDFRAAPPSAA